jgi:hypothetical protein
MLAVLLVLALAAGAHGGANHAYALAKRLRSARVLAPSDYCEFWAVQDFDVVCDRERNLTAVYMRIE